MPRSRLGLTRGGCRKPCGCFRKPVGAPPSCSIKGAAGTTAVVFAIQRIRGGCGKTGGSFRKHVGAPPNCLNQGLNLPASGGAAETPTAVSASLSALHKAAYRGRLWLTWGGGGKPCDCFRKPVGAPPNCRHQSWPVEAANNPTAISASPSALHQAA